MDVGHLIKNMPKKHNYTHIRAGDTVKVFYRVVEGERQRTQQIQGVVMWMTRNGANANITIRRVIDGVGVERTFLLNSPLLENIEIIRQGKTRRAKLFYQRGRTGRRARIKENTRTRNVIQTEEYLPENPEASVEEIADVSNSEPEPELTEGSKEQPIDETENVLSSESDMGESPDSEGEETDEPTSVADVSSEDEENDESTESEEESVSEEDSKN
ncbi:MAG: 50S ribosomal protein L19 [Chloroflexota bacterium]|nr:50S ribosomal protein L19 [Chloroflexota bacterium]